MKLNLAKFKPNTKRKKLCYLAALVVAILVAVLLITSPWSKSSPKATSKEPLITYSTDKPSESKKEADNYNWRGGPEDPKRIRISKLGVDAFIQKAGVDQNKQVAVPNNVHLASWFADSQRPGQKGLSVIDGHVSGVTTDGVFKKLKTLAAGDSFQVELGSGKVLNYKVLETVELKEADSASYLFSQKPTVTSQVNLITCGGSFNRAANQYENRVIVAAELQ